jgi:hypothetical protein
MDWLQKLAAISICLLVAVFVAPMGAVRSAAADSDAISTLAGVGEVVGVSITPMELQKV